MPSEGNNSDGLQPGELKINISIFKKDRNCILI